MKKIFLVIICVLSLGAINRAYASHAAGADLYYEYVGGNTYKVTFNLYRDCAGISAPANQDINITNTCGYPDTVITLTKPVYNIFGVPNGAILPGLCVQSSSNSTCSGGLFPGYEVYTYEGTITLPNACTNWSFEYSLCCRNASITNLADPDTYDQFLKATLNNYHAPGNSSPVFRNPPLLVIPYLAQVTYGHGISEADGDSIVYKLTRPLESDNTVIPYASGYSLYHPLILQNGSQFVFDSITGEFSYSPGVAQSAVIDVTVEEYRNGILVGSVMRDIQHTVVGPPTIGIPNAYPFKVPGSTQVSSGLLINDNNIESCINSTLDYNFEVVDSNLTDTLSFEMLTNLPNPVGGTNSPTVTYTGTNPVNVHVQWTPSANTQPGQYYIQFTVTDNACPITGLNYVTHNISLIAGVFAGDDQTYCPSSGPVQLEATYGSGFSWSPAAGLSNTSIANPLASPTVTTSYVVTGTPTVSGCAVTDTVVVTVNNNNVQPDIPRDSFVCRNEELTLYNAGQPGVQTSWKVGNQGFWVYNDTISYTANDNNTIILRVSDSTGCIGYDTAYLAIDTLSVIASSSYPSLCTPSTGTVMATVNNGFPPFSYNWTKITTTGSTSATGNTDTLTNTGGGTYTVQVIDSLGCEVQASTSLRTIGTQVKVSPYEPVVCNNEPATLGLPGTNISACQATDAYDCTYYAFPSEYVGTGRDTGFVSLVAAIPHVPGNETSGKVQLLYRADELLAAGVTRGYIEGMYFDYNSVNSTSNSPKFCELTVKIKCVSLDSLGNQFETGFETVFDPQYASFSDIKDFDRGYFWDGTSALLVSICYFKVGDRYNGCGAVYNLSVPILGYQNVGTYTPFRSCLYDVSTTISVNACNDVTNLKTSNFRPNARFKVCPAFDYSAYTAEWTPTTNLSSPHTINTEAHPTSTKTYTLTLTDSNGCSISGTKTVEYSDLQLPQRQDTSACGTFTATVVVNATGTETPFEFWWSSDSLTVQYSHRYTSNDNNVTSNGVDTGYAYVQVIDQLGCSMYDTIQIAYDPTCFTFASGYVYNDLNGNCVKDSTEPGIPNVLVETDEGILKFTNADGFYLVPFTGTGTHSVTKYTNSRYDALCPANSLQILNFTALGDTIYQVNFADTIHKLHDLWLTPNGDLPIAANNIVRLRMWYGNYGSEKTDATIEYYFDTAEVHISAFQVVANDFSFLGYTWDSTTGTLLITIDSLEANEQAFLHMIGLATFPGSPLIASDSAVIKPFVNDPDLANNTRVGNFGLPLDPNNKLVYPSGVCEDRRIAPGETLHDYTINFQNIGTAPAQNVVIRDTLDTDLQIRTFSAGASSFPYSIEIEGNNILVFTFTNINLPDSTTDPRGSQGFVSYTIQHDAFSPIGTIISNRAGIYFDAQPVVMTNEVSNKIATDLVCAQDTITTPVDTTTDTTGIVILTDQDFRLYPNPAKDELLIECQMPVEQIMVMDILGRPLTSKSGQLATNLQVNIADLEQGVYILVIKTANGASYTRRFTVMR